MNSAPINISSRSSLESGDSQLSAALEEFQRRTERGESPDIQPFASEFPAIEAELLACLTNMQQIQQLAQALSTPAAMSDTADFVHPAGVLGDYRILREVGRGGMGVVYEAEQISLSRRVALKILPFAAVLDPRQLQRFKNEAMAAAHLDHSNIVEVYGIGCERSIHFYAMRFVDGVTLAEVVAAKRDAQDKKLGTQKAEPQSSELDATSALSLPSSKFGVPSSAETSPVLQAALSTVNSISPKERFRRIAEIGIQAAEALDHAHQMGIVHRDIKPSNLMLDERGKLWVTDFGLARNQGDASMTMTGDLVGTLRYMSPEQALAKRITVDHRTDIYSLGVTLYELLALRAAFPSNDRQETLRQIAFDEPTTPRKLDKSIPEELETIVLKAMEKNPEDRYATARELADDLRRWGEHKPIVARAPGLVLKAKKWARRHSGTLATAAGVSAVAAIGLAIITALLVRATFAETAQRVKAENMATAANRNLTFALEAVNKMLSDNWADVPQAQSLRRQLLQAAVELCNQLEVTATDEDERASVLWMRAATYRRLGELERALVDADEVVRLRPSWKFAYETRSLIHLDGKDFSKALADLDKAMSFGLDGPAVHRARGLLLFGLKEYEQGHAELSAAITQDPQLPHTYFIRARLNTSRRHYAEADADYDQCLDQDPQNWTALIEQNGLLDLCPDETFRNPEKAKSVARKLISLCPGDESVDKVCGDLFLRWCAAGNVAQNTDMPDEARECAAKAVAIPLASPSIDLLMNRASCYERLGRWADALADAEAVIAQHDQGHVSQHQYLTTLEVGIGVLASCPDKQFRNGQRARDYAKRALALDNTDFGYYLLGTAEYACGDWKSALAALEAAESKSTSKPPHYLLYQAMTYWQLGEFDTAKEKFQEASPKVERWKPDVVVERIQKEAADLMGITLSSQFQGEAGDGK